jgi:hypothetical protein
VCVCVCVCVCVPTRVRVVGGVIRLFTPASLVGDIASSELDKIISMKSETGGM